MARQPEGRLVGNILNYLRATYPGWWEKIHGGPFQSRGVPDILGCHRGRFVSIEVKRPGEEPTTLQRENGKKIQQSGGLWMIAYSVDEVRDLMETHFKE